MMKDWSSEWDERGACRARSSDEEQERENGLHFEKRLYYVLYSKLVPFFTHSRNLVGYLVHHHVS